MKFGFINIMSNPFYGSNWLTAGSSQTSERFQDDDLRCRISKSSLYCSIEPSSCLELNEVLLPSPGVWLSDSLDSFVVSLLAFLASFLFFALLSSSDESVISKVSGSATIGITSGEEDLALSSSLRFSPSESTSILVTGSKANCERIALARACNSNSSKTLICPSSL
ncbi:hypothetical protein FF38_08406 [Lucilia cuprina]|uniref:Uncharacterized protein n=1 Tax=Lucilia cuprina TaxID=7375 RepID=A0A0L0BMX4_LUCCU|nr:hypothetical protein FF38_08406 [Lucilia cuprina]